MVKTPSRLQVRNPINTDSIGRWRKLWKTPWPHTTVFSRMPALQLTQLLG